MSRKWALGLLLVAVAIGLVSCGGSSKKAQPGSSAPTTGTVVIVGEKS
ncbi:MAG: hypothetical protein HY762_06705 [Planctomycetes bacterium]|nr:hypothetical protein [Planctomycetota bacterium]